MNALLDLARKYDVKVVRSALPGNVLGCWLPHQHTIHIDSRLTPTEQRTVLAHELGHVHHGHLCSSMPAIKADDANERQADTFAARLLIDPREYAHHERINPDRHEIADELGVTVELVHVYAHHCLTRVRGMTYTHAKHGIGQWAHRAEVA